MNLYLQAQYKKYVEQCKELGNEILSYEDWKDSQGYRGEYDPDND